MSMVLEHRGVEANALEVKRNDVWFVDFGDREGSEQRGLRPALVISNDRGNRFSPVVMVVPLSSQITKAKLPTHVVVKERDTGIARDSFLMFEQIHSVYKTKLKYKLFELPQSYDREVERAIMVSVRNNR